MEFADKVRSLLEQRRLSQNDLALEVGTSQQQVSRWLGENKPPAKYFQLLRLARALGVPADYLIDPAQDEPSSALSEDERAILDTYHALVEHQGLSRRDVIGRMIAPPPVKLEDIPVKATAVDPPRPKRKPAG